MKGRTSMCITRFHWPLGIILTLCGVSGAYAQTLSEAETAAVEEAVLEANKAMNQASADLNADLFFSWIAEDAAIIQDGILFSDRDEVVRVVKQGYEGVESLKRDFTETNVKVLSREIALLTASGTSTVVLSDGRTLVQSFAVSLVFVLRDETWKVVQGHFSVPNPR